MELRRDTIIKAIMQWSLRFPSQHREPEVLAILAGDYYDDLESDFSEELFRVADKLVKKTCMYFPQVADLYRVRDEAIGIIARAKQERRLALPEVQINLTPEKERRREELCAVVCKAIRGEIPYLEAAEKMEKVLGFSVEWPGRRNIETKKE